MTQDAQARISDAETRAQQLEIALKKTQERLQQQMYRAELAEKSARDAWAFAKGLMPGRLHSGPDGRRMAGS